MYSFKQYLSESKNTHLEHLEDSIINDGYQGGLASIEFLKSLRNMLTGSSRRKVNVSVKWDGAPAVFCGINPENGRFFVGSKSVFNVNPKINYTQADIRKNHAGGLVDKLSVCLKELPKLNIKGVVQGDLLFTPADLKKVSIRGEDAIAFTPNTITYAVPENTDLAKRILRAKLGIIFHTTYNGRKMANLKASGVSTFSTAESDRYDALLRMANGSLQRGKKVLELLKRQNNLLSVGARLKIFFNTKIRQGSSIGGVANLQKEFRKYYAQVLDDEASTKKTQSAKQKYEMIRNDG